VPSLAGLSRIRAVRFTHNYWILNDSQSYRICLTKPYQFILNFFGQSNHPCFPLFLSSNFRQVWFRHDVTLTQLVWMTALCRWENRVECQLHRPNTRHNLTQLNKILLVSENCQTSDNHTSSQSVTLFTLLNPTLFDSTRQQNWVASNCDLGFKRPTLQHPQQTSLSLWSWIHWSGTLLILELYVNASLFFKKFQLNRHQDCHFEWLETYQQRW
jgi:hypothetical protein